MDEEKIKDLVSNETLFKELLDIHLKTPNKVDPFFIAAKRIYIEGRQPPIHFWGLIGGLFYMIYRKMYISYIPALIVSILFLLFMKGSLYYIIIVFAVSCGYYGYRFYFDTFFFDLMKSGYGKKPIAEVKQNLSLKGGTFWFAHILYFIFWGVFVVKLVEYIVYS